jgi:tetratricopeptide (TPR) repeat protein
MSGRAGETTPHPRTPKLSSADQTAFQNALDAFDKGHLTEAEVAIRSLAGRHPGDAQIQEAAAEIEASQSKYVDAVSYFRAAAALDPENPIVHANLGATYLELGQNAEAVTELRASIKLDRNNFDTLSNLGRALMATGSAREAAEVFGTAAAIHPTDWDTYYNWAVALDSAGLMTKAAAVLSRIPVRSSTWQGQSLAGEIAEKQGFYKEAADHFQLAARLEPSDDNIYALALEYLRHWTWKEARDVAQFGNQKYPASVHFLVIEGIASYADNNYSAAADIFSRLLTTDPNNALYADLLGRNCSLLAENSLAACSGLVAFAEGHPTNAQASVYAATALLNRPSSDQDPETASRLLDNAIKADPTLADAYYEYGVLRQQRNQWSESKELLEKAISLRPEFAEAHYRLARALAHLGDHEAAKKEMALQQQYSQQAKDRLNAKLKEVTTFVVESSSSKPATP